MIPQILYIALTFMSLGLALSQHGQEKKGKHNFFTAFLAAIIIWAILYYGDFFNPLLTN